jgi:PRC-barrel domain
MLSHEQLKSLLESNAKVFGSDGEKIGTLGHVYLDGRTGIPDFVAVHTGFLGSTENFVPLHEAEISNGNLYVKFPKDFVKDAPDIEPTWGLSARDEKRLYDYYSRAGAGSLHAGATPDPRQAHDEPGPPKDPDATAPGEHTVHVVREHHMIRVAGILHDDFAPGHPRLRKDARPGEHEPSSVDDPTLPPLHPEPYEAIEEPFEGAAKRPTPKKSGSTGHSGS